MGLETVHPDVLPRLNKRMTLDYVPPRGARSGRWRRSPCASSSSPGCPGSRRERGPDWARRSIEFAFDCGAGAVSLIATRAGNGAMEALREAGDFEPPTLGLLENCLADGLRLAGGRVFADLWDLDALATCGACVEPRRARLSAMNLSQALLPPVACAACGAA